VATTGDAVIVNTCAVTSEAERKARQAIRRARRERPAARVIVTGCSAQIDPARYAAMPEVDQVLGNLAKLSAESYRATAPRLVADDIMAVRKTAAHLVEDVAGRRLCPGGQGSEEQEDEGQEEPLHVTAHAPVIASAGP